MLTATTSYIVQALVWRHLRVHQRWKSRVLRSFHRRRPQKLTNFKGNGAADSFNGDKLILPKRNKYYAEKICDICGRKFVNGKTLSKHIKCVHNKIKSFICNVCGKKMARKASLNVSEYLIQFYIMNLFSMNGNV